MANPYGITLSRTWTEWTAKQGLSETVAAALSLVSQGRKADEGGAKLTPGEMEGLIQIVQQWPAHFPRGALAAVRDSKPKSSLAPLYAALVAERAEAPAPAPRRVG